VFRIPSTMAQTKSTAQSFGEPRRCLSPDLFVKLGVPDSSFGTWKAWERGGPPELGVEIINPNEGDGIDWDEKLARYHELGVKELLRFDPAEAEGRRLRAWDRVHDDLVERQVTGIARRASRSAWRGPSVPSRESRSGCDWRTMRAGCSRRARSTGCASWRRGVRGRKHARRSRPPTTSDGRQSSRDEVSNRGPAGRNQAPRIWPPLGDYTDKHALLGRPVLDAATGRADAPDSAPR
jgi:hypothetical protein